MTNDTSVSVQDRAKNAKRLMEQWSNDMEKDTELIVKAFVWIVDHPHHHLHREQVNKYFELKSKYAETDFWYYTCLELEHIGYTILTPIGSTKSYEVSHDTMILEAKPECLLPQEFALERSDRISR